MSATCTKEFFLHVGSVSVISYWKFNEAAAGDVRDDSVSSNDLTPDLGGGLSVVAGKIGNAAGFDTLNRGLISLAPSSDLIYDPARGITFMGWIKSTDTAFVDFNNLFTLESLDAPFNQWSFSFGTGLNNVNFNCNDGVNIDGISKAIVLGTWHFMRAWIDPTDNKMRFQLDLGSITVGTVVLSNFEVATQSQVRMSTSVFGTVRAKQFDEFGVWDGVVSNATAAFIYNSGAGRTYPFA